LNLKVAAAIHPTSNSIACLKVFAFASEISFLYVYKKGIFRERERERERDCVVVKSMIFRINM